MSFHFNGKRGYSVANFEITLLVTPLSESEQPITFRYPIAWKLIF